MKIICVGRNYTAHAQELGNPVPEHPVLFMKPQTALLQSGKDLYYPEFTKDLHYEAELVFRVGRNGKYIAEKFAWKYINAVTLGIDFTARDLQEIQKQKGLPWEIAKAFDGSAVRGELLPIDSANPPSDLSFSLQKNGATVQKGNIQDMLFSIPKIISYASQFFTLNTGDLIFTGTPAGTGPVQIDDKLIGYIHDEKMFEITIR